MADGYDRYGQENGDGGSFVMGLLTGTVLGAGLGMLFAPKAGSELRSQLGTQLSDSTGRLREVADQGYQQASEKVSQIVDRGREAYDRARGNMAAAGTTGAGSERSTTGSTSSGATGNIGSTGNVGPTGGYGA